MNCIYESTFGYRYHDAVRLLTCLSIDSLALTIQRIVQTFSIVFTFIIYQESITGVPFEVGEALCSLYNAFFFACQN